MKYLAILSFLFAGTLHAQTTFKTLQKFDNKSLEFRMDRLSTKELSPIRLNIPDQSILETNNIQSGIKLFSPQQYNPIGYPMNDLSNMDDLLMGTSLSNTVQLGRQKIQTTYIFDINGDLIGTETSLSFGKKKK